MDRKKVEIEADVILCLSKYSRNSSKHQLAQLFVFLASICGKTYATNLQETQFPNTLTFRSNDLSLIYVVFEIC